MISQVTVSAQGGTVRDPEYSKYVEESGISCISGNGTNLFIVLGDFMFDIPFRSGVSFSLSLVEILNEDKYVNS